MIFLRPISLNSQTFSVISKKLLLALVLCGTGIAAAQQNCTAPLTRPDTRYEVVAGATPPGSEVRDKVSGLIWQRCLLGQRWDNNNCVGVATPKTLQQALDIAALGPQTTASPATRWRMPTVNELTSLVEPSCRNPAINTRWFPNGTVPSGTNAWTYSLVEGTNNDEAWYVSFFDGVARRGVRIVSALNIRFVRDAQ